MNHILGKNYDIRLGRYIFIQLSFALSFKLVSLTLSLTLS